MVADRMLEIEDQTLADRRETRNASQRLQTIRSWRLETTDCKPSNTFRIYLQSVSVCVVQ